MHTAKQSVKRARRPLAANSERRWLGYALAAGAGLTTGAQPAKAAIDYTPAHRFLQVGDNYLIDLNHDGRIDFQIYCGESLFVESVAYLEINPAANSQAASVIGNKQFTHPFAAALPAGARIGPNDHFENIAFYNQAFLGYSRSGQWLNVMHRYLGLRFTLSGLPHYGWIELSVRTQSQNGLEHVYSAEVEGYAYETTPGLGILAGAGKPGSVGQSRAGATLGALALGSPGLDIWRKERTSVGETQPSAG